MSEVERKGKHKAVRIILYTARWAGIASFVGGLLIVPYAFCDALVTSGEMDYWFDAHFLILMYYSLYFYGPLFAISLILSLIASDFEQDNRFRTLKLVLAGIFLYALYLFIIYYIMFHTSY